MTGHHAESVRRGGKSLERKGLVVVGWDNGWSDFAPDAGGLKKRIPAGPTYRLSADYLSTLTIESSGPVDPQANGATVADLAALL